LSVIKRQTVQVTKTEAAERQLRQAIRLVFQRGDMLAIHTLGAASLQLLADLGKPQGILSPIRYTDRIKSEYQKEWFRALNRTQNFLKHADNDAGIAHEYDENETLLLLFEAVVMRMKRGSRLIIRTL
jgi:hypothetical protein